MIKEKSESWRGEKEKTLEAAIGAFSVTEPNTEEERFLAENLIEGLVFDRFPAQETSEEDLALYLREIRRAAEIVAPSLIKSEWDGVMTREEVRRWIDIMIERGFVDPKRNPLVASFMQRSS